MLESELHRETKRKEKIEEEGFLSGGQGDASTCASTSVHSPARTRTGEEFMKQFSKSLVQGNSAGTENQMQTMMASMQMMMDSMRMMMADVAQEAAKIRKEEREADEKK